MRVAVPPQQYAEIIEPSHHALQFDAVDQKNGQRNFAFANVIEKGVLKVLCSFGWHCRFPIIFAREPHRRPFIRKSPGHMIMGHWTWGMGIRWHACFRRKPKFAALMHKMVCFLSRRFLANVL